MNWDTTKLQEREDFSSNPLTITGIEKIKVPFFTNTWDCYLIKVKESITYRKNTASNETVTKNEFITFQRTYKGYGQLSNETNDVFYYFAHHFRKENSTKIPFKGYLFNKDSTNIVFFLDEKENEIIRGEKRRWDSTGFTEEKDLKVENVWLVNAKWEALEKDINGNSWNPSLNEEEKKLIKDAQTVNKVREAQIRISLLREQKGQDNKVEELKKQIEDLKKLKEAKLKTSKEINDAWHRATMIDRREKDAVLGENWENKLIEKETLEEVIKERDRSINKIRDKEKIENQNQGNFEKEIQEKIDKAQDFIDDSASEGYEKIVDDLRDIRSKWGSSEQATPAQWRAFLKKEVVLNKAINDIRSATFYNEAVREIKKELKPFRPGELLVKNEHINFERTLNNLWQTNKAEEMNEFENTVLKLIFTYKPARSHLMETIDKIRKIFQNKSESSSLSQENWLEFHDELEGYEKSSPDSAKGIAYSKQEKDTNEFKIKSLEEARKFALTNLEEKKNQIIKEFSGLTNRIEQMFEHHQEQTRQASSRDLKTQIHERNFEREVNRLLLSNHSTTQPPKLNLDKIIKDAKEAKSIEELKRSIKLLNDYRDSQNEEIKRIYEQRKEEVNNLRDLLAAKLRANEDIEKVLAEGYPISEANGDIIPDYQGHAEKIKNFTEKQNVENFAKEMIDYLGKQKAAHESLSNALKTAADVSSNNRDQEEGIFEKRLQIRQKLDKLSEDTSLEAKKAYQAMNKNDKVAIYRKQIATQIWEYLKEGAKKSVKDPSNKAFFEEIEKQGHKEGTEGFELYWIIREIVKKFSDKNFEGKEIPVYPYVEKESLNGAANSSTTTTTIIKGNEVNKIITQKYTLFLNFKRSMPQVLSTLPHELTHFVMYWLQIKGLLPGGQEGDQRHSKAFWDTLYYKNNYPINDRATSFSYVLSCLSPEKYQEIKDISDLSVDSLINNNRCHYFPELGSIIKAEEGKKRLKKYFNDEQVNEGWESTRKALKLANDSMDKEPEKNWTSSEEKDKRWVQMHILHKKKALSAADFKEGKDKHKCYVFYNENNVPEDLKKEVETKFNDWIREDVWRVKTDEKLEKMCSRIEEEGIIKCGCEVKCEEQVAKVVDNPLSLAVKLDS